MGKSFEKYWPKWLNQYIILDYKPLRVQLILCKILELMRNDLEISVMLYLYGKLEISIVVNMRAFA